MHTLSAASAAAGLLAFVASASAHGFVREWTADGVTEKAQKQSLGSTAFRSVSDNTGWVGSNFLTSPAITCGASNNPKGTVAQPSGTIFSSADQAAGKTMAVKAGSEIELVIAGNPGDGWPHHQGHIQTYLASCGTSATACQNFDASKGQFFKIQAEKDGIQNKLVPAYDSGVDGNRWKVPIPQDVADGSYIMRLELIAFGQSGSAEGNQDQYYPFCGQISVSGGSGASKLSTVTFPGAYKNGNIDQSSLPGPAASGSGSSGSGSSPTTSQPGSSDSGSTSTSSGSDSTSSGNGSSTSGNGSSTSGNGSSTSGSGSSTSGSGSAESGNGSTSNTTADSGNGSTPSESRPTHSHNGSTGSKDKSAGPGLASSDGKSCNSSRRRRSQSRRARRHAGRAHGKRVPAAPFAHGHS